VHSHAFQRGMAGLTEARTRGSDSFWTWRELMYRFASRISAVQAADIAAWLYVEMLKAGYTSVAEFHYLHHDTDGRAFADHAEMSHGVIAAAQSAGIALTHLPVLYQYSGFGAKPALPAQARFLHSAPDYLALLESLHARYDGVPNLRIGAAFHSLRAVDRASLREVLVALQSRDGPVHIHVAEQREEVEDCIAWSGERPVRWLLENVAPDARWCLVHATHLDEPEIEALAASGAVAGLCPTTEAYLGDGIFPAAEYASHQGRFGIGSDSHVEVNVASELRLLEYAQRLVRGKRSVLASASQPSPGERLYVEAARGGAQALGIEAGRIAPGCRADLVVLDPEQPVMWNKASGQVLDAWIFAGDASCVRDVMSGGTWRVRNRRHARELELSRRFRAAQAALLA
jgi:formimidoylglutamate deiminase